MAQVRWTRDALSDLGDIHRFIARDAPAAAAATIVQVLASAERLRAFPRSGRVVPEFEDEALREIITGNYRIIYRLRGEEVQIIRIRHGARLLEESDFQED